MDQAAKHLGDVLIGEDPFAIERHWQRMFRRAFFPTDKVYGCAISAIGQRYPNGSMRTICRYNMMYTRNLYGTFVQRRIEWKVGGGETGP